MIKVIKKHLNELLILIISMFLLHSTVAFAGADTTYKPGDTIQINVQRGNYVMLLFGGVPLWYNPGIDSFGVMPQTNFDLVYYEVTRRTPLGEYQLIEVNSDGDPTNLNNWRWVKATGIRVQNCNSFNYC